jgi:protease-4
MKKTSFIIFLLILLLLVFLTYAFYQSNKPYYLEIPISSMLEDEPKIRLGFLFEKTISFPKFMYELSSIKDDKKLKGIIFDLTDYQLNWEQTEELRKLIKSLKNTICYADSYKEKAYYLATACKRIYMPYGNIIEIPGIYSQVLYFKQLLDSLKIKFYSINFEEYKTALEPFTNKEPSKYELEQINRILDNHYNELKNALKERGIENSDSIINKIAYIYTDDAIKLKLIDGIKYLDEIENDFKTYKKRNLTFKKKLSNKKIVVIGAEGEIFQDKYDPITKELGIGKDFARALREIRNDKNVVAVLIRANSPGGSSFVSDLIAREIRKLSKEKFVVISMGRVCASGCYYMSAYANKIFAEKLTITGSIGVIFAKISTEKFYKEKLFINPYIFKRGEHADIFSSRELTNEEYIGMKDLVRKIYDDFLKVVSNGRKIKMEKVREIAKGRVYTSLDGKEIGLIDTIGGFLEALDYLKNKYKNASVVFYNRNYNLNIGILNQVSINDNILFLEPILLKEIFKP